MTRLLHIRRARDSAAGEPSSPRRGTDAAPGNAGERSDDGTVAEQGRDAAKAGAGTVAEQGRDVAKAGDGTVAEQDRDAEDAGDGTDAARDEGIEAPPTGRRSPRWGRLRRAAPAVGAVALVLAGCGFFHGAHQLRSTPSAGNAALTDTAASTRVAGDVGNALARVFSYTPEGVEATERSARTVLGGRAARQYAELMERIRADLAEQRVTLSTQPVRTGVIELDGDRARLLVFLDQISHRGKDGTTSAAAQLTVTARWEEDQWRIVDIRTH
ncbi:nuclear transport factor 2 family protein [Streptomyces sp. b94]|uniref:nuclear transport factor 2 family protein n=1 Tax=Streptomyces sp. b94 TaxID=1827634 RepID=UPI001B37D4AE|nr:nuclear transport factor 2 family protein [Streptomyces sp. b94]MBQ1100360.1 nuclear transport factor 2 family protein [Streptomyces sp. b94]